MATTAASHDGGTAPLAGCPRDRRDRRRRRGHRGRRSSPTARRSGSVEYVPPSLRAGPRSEHSSGVMPSCCARTSSSSAFARSSSLSCSCSCSSTCFPRSARASAAPAAGRRPSMLSPRSRRCSCPAWWPSRSCSRGSRPWHCRCRRSSATPGRSRTACRHRARSGSWRLPRCYRPPRKACCPPCSSSRSPMSCTPRASRPTSASTGGSS